MPHNNINNIDQIHLPSKWNNEIVPQWLILHLFTWIEHAHHCKQEVEDWLLCLQELPERKNSNSLHQASMLCSVPISYFPFLFPLFVLLCNKPSCTCGALKSHVSHVSAGSLFGQLTRVLASRELNRWCHCVKINGGDRMLWWAQVGFKLSDIQNLRKPPASQRQETSLTVTFYFLSLKWPLDANAII